MKKFKRIITVALVMCLLTALCGCDVFSTPDELLKPPRPGGELSDIRQALDSLVSESYTLKYPTAGEYRSAIVRYDILGDGRQEAVAFYSTEKDNISSMHITVLTESGKNFQAVKDASVLAAGIERVEFQDLDGDGKSEIIVGWSIYGNVDKQVSVYSFDGKALTPRLNEKYTKFLCCNLNTDQKNELFVVNLKNTEKAASAHLYELKENGINKISSCETDALVTEYVSINEGKLLNGKPAIFLDGKKGPGMSTEILFLSDNKLINPLYNKETGNNQTDRALNVAIMDSDENGTLDIPMTEVLSGYEEAPDQDKIYTTKWCGFDGEKLVVTLSAVMNYTDGYFFEIPKELEGKITIARNLETRTRVFYLYDAKQKKRGAALFRIMAVSENRWISEKEDYKDWEAALTENAVVYAVQKTQYEGEGALSLAEIKKLIKPIR